MKASARQTTPSAPVQKTVAANIPLPLRSNFGMDSKKPSDSKIIMTELVLPNDTDVFGNLDGRPPDVLDGYRRSPLCPKAQQCPGRHGIRGQYIFSKILSCWEMSCI
ncbi:MAG: hypothetical protein QM755_01700 [Luteolibacter sp.]